MFNLLILGRMREILVVVEVVVGCLGIVVGHRLVPGETLLRMVLLGLTS